jgi:hypothetical protein
LRAARVKLPFLCERDEMLKMPKLHGCSLYLSHFKITAGSRFPSSTIKAADEVILPEIAGINIADDLKSVAGNRRRYRDLLGLFATSKAMQPRRFPPRPRVESRSWLSASGIR